jgi:hypothetical protein
MSLTTIDIFRQAAEPGLRLKAIGHHLHVSPGRCCPPEFIERLRTHKPRLLPLLTLPFVMVDSKALGETIFFCEDEDTKAALIEADAAPASVYTREELRVLVEQHRRAPITAAELLRIHGARRAFNGRLTR